MLLAYCYHSLLSALGAYGPRGTRHVTQPFTFPPSRIPFSSLWRSGALALWRYRLPSAHFARRLEAPARGNPSRRMTFRLFARSSDPAAFAVIYRRITQYHSITASSGKHRRDVETVGSAKPVRADVTCAQPGRPVACVRVPRVLARDCVILPSMLATLCPAWLPCELQVGRLVGVSFWFLCWFLSFLDFLISCSQFKSCLQVFCSSLHLFFLS